MVRCPLLFYGAPIRKATLNVERVISVQKIWEISGLAAEDGLAPNAGLEPDAGLPAGGPTMLFHTSILQYNYNVIFHHKINENRNFSSKSVLSRVFTLYADASAAQQAKREHLV